MSYKETLGKKKKRIEKTLLSSNGIERESEQLQSSHFSQGRVDVTQG